MDTTKATAKERMIQFIRKLPNGSSYDEIMYQLYVWQKIEKGLADVDAGRVVSQDEIDAEFLLNRDSKDSVDCH
jgi:predicted transcriptional regulator